MGADAIVSILFNSSAIAPGAAPNLLEKQPACRFSPRCSFYKEKTCSNLADELYVNGERTSRCPIGGIV
ncbi:hypothetical protein AN644_00640 [Candidatus Epulonipiscium fishelsonii]|nr:hypothetical protein AN644_00640 [Epulopiscium sp. SCG-C06WGA-EpuloA1]